MERNKKTRRIYSHPSAEGRDRKCLNSEGEREGKNSPWDLKSGKVRDWRKVNRAHGQENENGPPLILPFVSLRSKNYGSSTAFAGQINKTGRGKNSSLSSIAFLPVGLYVSGLSFPKVLPDGQQRKQRFLVSLSLQGDKRAAYPPAPPVPIWSDKAGEKGGGGAPCPLRMSASQNRESWPLN